MFPVLFRLNLLHLLNVFLNVLDFYERVILLLVDPNEPRFDLIDFEAEGNTDTCLSTEFKIDEDLDRMPVTS